MYIGSGADSFDATFKAAIVAIISGVFNVQIVYTTVWLEVDPVNWNIEERKKNENLVLLMS